jgi:hypothetical protein
MELSRILTMLEQGRYIGTSTFNVAGSAIQVSFNDYASIHGSFEIPTPKDAFQTVNEALFPLVSAVPRKLKLTS